jgi:antitoxin component of MazEF toxin-antitoxin module
MIRNITRIGNSQGIIIPNNVLQEMGYPKTVEITPTKDGIFISPVAGRTIRRKPRNEHEANGFYNLMKSKINTFVTLLYL